MGRKVISSSIFMSLSWIMYDEERYCPYLALHLRRDVNEYLSPDFTSIGDILWRLVRRNFAIRKSISIRFSASSSYFEKKYSLWPAQTSICATMFSVNIPSLTSSRISSFSKGLHESEICKCVVLHES